MARFSVTIQCETAADLAAVAAYLDLMPSAPTRSSPREADDEAPPPPRPRPQSPRGRDAAPSPLKTGNQLLGWIGDQPNPRVALKRVQSLGKARGYGWQIKAWKPEWVADVFREVAAPRGQWGGA